jgi:hypothetical protein
LTPEEHHAASPISRLEAEKLRLFFPQSRVSARWAAIALAVVAWVPLLVFSAIQGSAWAHPDVPFLKDFATHVRLLLAIPAFVLADLPARLRLREIVGQFSRSRLIFEKDRLEFTSIVEDASKWWDLGRAQIVLLALAYATTYLNFLQFRAHFAHTWYVPSPAEHVSVAGYWFLLVALPIFQYFIYRWLYQTCVWAALLWRVSRLHLDLSAAHPDRAAGLSFLGKSLASFGTIGFAFGAVLSGLIANRMFFHGDALQSFVPVYGALIALTLVLFAGPLLPFTPKLIRLKYRERLKYGAVLARRTRSFEHTWDRFDLNDSNERSVQVSAAVPSLADLRNSFDLVLKMRIVVALPMDLVPLVVLTLLPALPLVATAVPMGEIFKFLLHLIG